MITGSCFQHHRIQYQHHRFRFQHPRQPEQGIAIAVTSDSSNKIEMQRENGQQGEAAADEAALDEAAAVKATAGGATTDEAVIIN